jgi:hypothetical protein
VCGDLIFRNNILPSPSARIGKVVPPKCWLPTQQKRRCHSPEDHNMKLDETSYNNWLWSELCVSEAHE